MRRLLLTLLILTLFISISYPQLSVKIVSPKDGETVSGNVTIKVEVSDPTNASKVEFYINNEKVGEVTKSPFEYILDTTLYPNGEYNVIVRAYEKKGSMTGISVNIKIENIYKDWQKIYGGSDYDEATSIQQTTDGGYIVAGRTFSFGAGKSDVYVIKLDENGNKLWEKTYGGSSDDGASSIQQTRDGGYIVAGWTGSFEAGYADVYVIKLDDNGNKVWEKTYGGSGDDDATSIQQTKDGGYIVAGSTRSFGFDQDAYVIKLDENGNLTYSVNNLIYSSNMVKEKVKSAMKIIQTALEMNAIDNNGFYTDNLLDLLDYLPDNQFPKHPLTNKPYEIGINLFDPVNGGSPVKNSSDPRYQYAIVYKCDASSETYTLIGYDQTNTKVIFILSNR